MRRSIMFLALALTFLLILGPALGQTPNTCPEIVRQALFSLGNNCTSMGRNSACYGFNRVNATFAQAVDAGFFSRPADRADLTLIERLTTSPLDEALAHWGIAVLNVQANIPDTLPGQAVTVLLLGDAEIENAVENVAPVSLAVNAQANIFTAPNVNNNILTSIPAGTSLQADGLSEDGLWVRVQQPNGAGWIDRNVIDPAVDLTALPAITADTQTPMQSFYFRTAFNDIACTEAPSVLSIRSPENIKVDLNVNGADIRLGSMVVLRIIPPGNAMQIMTIEGEAILEPDTPNQVIVPAGYTTQRCLADPENLGVDGESNDQEVYDECQWLYPVLLTEEEQALGRLVLNSYNGLQQPTLTPSPTPTVPPAPSCVTGQAITHVVAPGETLFSIAQRYRTTINAIMFANRLTNTNIFAGQQITVNCGDQSNPPIVTDEPLPVDCGRFFASAERLIDSNLPFRLQWAAVSGATSYRLNLSGPLGNQSLDAGLQLELTPTLSLDPQAYPITWNVEALIGSRVACSTPAGTLTLDGEVTQEPPTGTVDCSSFRASSPLGGMAYGQETFYWDPAPGATSYVVVIAGETATTGFDAGNNTSMTIPTGEGSIGFGLQFTWSVAALLNGREACQTQAVTIFRESAPEQPQPEVTDDPMTRAERACIANGGRWVIGGPNGPFCDFGTATN